ncbi:2-oxo acid dehydrogenase subunit E2 [Eubacteriales bacterium OttesenSCG-928-K08]|nr:2-oxo acid dehydrogenase subunit E2 [Eubacteriales bacterium OttesenSCG-928-K08]
MQNTFKKGLFDRYDGWRVRNVDAVFGIIPFILRTRIDSQNFFEENIPIENIEAFVRKYKSEIPDLTFMHVIIAALIRMYAHRPYLNRFVVWNKIYARNSISMSLVIKRTVSDRGEETLVKPEFEPTDTVYDVVERMTKIIEDNIPVGTQNSSDKLSRIFRMLPSFVVRFAAFLMHNLDKVGLLPKAINKASPWHCGLFLTNLGSLGIGPIYHHLYEFGTCSVFVAMGNKTRIHTVSGTGEREVKRFIGLKFVTDERVCDGHYYAASMKLLRRFLANPEQLLEPPAQVIIDDGVDKPRIDI